MGDTSGETANGFELFRLDQLHLRLLEFAIGLHEVAIQTFQFRLGSHLLRDVLADTDDDGVVDGAENNWPSYESTGHFEVAGFYSLSQHLIIPECVCINADVYNALSDDQKAAVKEAAMESAALQRELWTERAKASKEKVMASGVEFNEIAYEECKRLSSIDQDDFVDDECLDYYEAGEWLKDIYFSRGSYDNGAPPGFTCY